MELNKLYNADCMQAMKEIPDNSIDLIITSPPYNLGNNHHTGGNRHNPYNDNMKEQDYQQWQIELINECVRVLKSDGSMFYNHKNRIKDGLQISPYEWLFKTNILIKQEIVWFNRSQNFDKCRFYPMTERIYWLTKNPKTKLFNAINHHDLFNSSEWQAEGTQKEHKRAYPIKMVEDILSCFPDKKTVLDPFMGSGTTAIACYNMGFDYVGYEIDKDYYNGACKRIEEVKAQIRFSDLGEL